MIKLSNFLGSVNIGSTNSRQGCSWGSCLYAFVDKLRTFEGGIPAASDGGFACRTADMGVAAGCFCLIAVAAC